MKRSWFWRVVAALALILAAYWLYSQRWQYVMMGQVRVHRLTGMTQIYSNGDWVKPE